MTQKTATFRFDRCATLVIATLISLCVSKNVGPQFIPWPDLPQHVAESRPEGQVNSALRFPSSEFDNFRVPIVVWTHKRAGTDLLPQPLAASASRSCFEQPVDVRSTHDCSTSIFLISDLVAQQPGRAPPVVVV
jgi:hypothetical protein